MLIDHTHKLYTKKRNQMEQYNRYNGAYYYSKEIVKNIIPNVKTDRNWVTVRLPEINTPNHSIVFIHNNRNPNYYTYLKDSNDLILVTSTKHTYENMKFFSDKVIYLPLSVDIKQVEKYKKTNQTKTYAYAGRVIKMNNKIPKQTDIITNLPQSKLLKTMSDYQYIYAVGRTAIQAKILGATILPYDNIYPDPNIWQILDNKDASKILQSKLDIIDGIIKE